MPKNDKTQLSNDRKHDKKKIHPTVSCLSLNIFDKVGMKYSDAFETFATSIASNDAHLIAKQEILKFKIQELEKDIKEIEQDAANKIARRKESIKECEQKLKAIDNSLMDYYPSESDNGKAALDEVMQLVKEARIEANGKKWGVKKVPLAAISDIAESKHIRLESLLSMINDDVKRDWIQHYNKI